MQNRAVVLTISDAPAKRASEDADDLAIVGELPTLDATLVHRETIPCELERVRGAVSTWVDRCEILFTTGGTGIGPGDVTPEAILPLIDRHLPGFGEVIRAKALPDGPESLTCRAGAGYAGDTLVVWLPGSPRAVAACLDVLILAIQHACEATRKTPRQR